MDCIREAHTKGKQAVYATVFTAKFIYNIWMMSYRFKGMQK